MSLPIGLQLYTLRDVLKDDFDGTLEKVKHIGFDYIEFAGYGAYTAEQMKKVCERIGLTPTSAHVGLDFVRDHTTQAIDDAKALGYKYVVIPYLPSPLQDSLDGYRETAKLFNDIGAKLSDEGLTLCYHNHDFEFKQLGGGHGYDVLVGETDSAKVQFELDIMWVDFAGEDVAGWMNKLSGRLPIIHVKDRVAGGERKFAEVGTGVVDIEAAVSAAADSGVEYLVVEQDNHWSPSPLSSVETSFGNLAKVLNG